MDRPWFKFFAADFLTDPRVDALPPYARDVLMRMWCICHIEGSCPADPKEIARKGRLTLESVMACIEQVQQFFDLRDGRLYSLRMLREQEKSDAARASVNRRWHGRNTNRSTDRNSDRTTQSQSQSQNQSQDQSQKRKGAAAPTRTRFEPPTLEQVAEYCALRKNRVDPQQFFDHYRANGWKVGRNPMRNWRSSVNTWERNGVNSNGRNITPERVDEELEIERRRASARRACN